MVFDGIAVVRRRLRDKEDEDTGRRKTGERVREECDERKDKAREDDLPRTSTKRIRPKKERARQCEPTQKDDGRHGGQGRG